MARRHTIALNLLVFFAAHALASDAGLSGTWVLDRARSDDVNAAIEKTVRRTNVFIRSVARSRLRKTNPPYERITLTFSAGEARVGAGPGSPIVLPASGKAVRWKRPGGEVFMVSGRMSGSSYVETFEAKDGRRTNTFSVNGERMNLDVIVTSPRLAAPLRYRLVYRRP